tara:strand:+ start:66 stop:275 length:210 start_codon:yes stop_codon:yes gene_type:complete
LKPFNAEYGRRQNAMTEDDIKKLSRNDDYQLRVMNELFGVLQRDWEKFARESTIEYEVDKKEREDSDAR